MEAISYVNIFETKGLEYLVVISFMITFLVFVRFLIFSNKNEDALPAENTVTQADPVFICLADHDCPYKSPIEAQEEGIKRASGS